MPEDPEKISSREYSLFTIGARMMAIMCYCMLLWFLYVFLVVMGLSEHSPWPYRCLRPVGYRNARVKERTLNPAPQGPK